MLILLHKSCHDGSRGTEKREHMHTNPDSLGNSPKAMYALNIAPRIVSVNRARARM